MDMIMYENRFGPRKSQLKAALAVFNGARSTVSCTLQTCPWLPRAFPLEAGDHISDGDNTVQN